jgi:WD40 repeat protein
MNAVQGYTHTVLVPQLRFLGLNEQQRDIVVADVTMRLQSLLTGRSEEYAFARIHDLEHNREVFLWKLSRRVFEGIAFSPDGRYLAIACVPRDNRSSLPRELVIHDWRNNQIHQRIRGNMGRLGADACRENGLLVTTAPEEGLAQVWDSENGNEILGIRAPAEVRDATLSPHSKKVAVACVDGKVRVWDATTEQGVLTFRGHGKSPVNNLVFSHDGKRIAQCCSDGAVVVWERNTGKVEFKRERPNAWKGAIAVALDPTGKRLVVTNKDKDVIVWSVPDGNELAVLEHKEAIVVAFSPDGSQLATAGFDNTIKIWETATAKLTWRLEGHSRLISSIAFTTDSSSLASTSDDGTVRIWNLATGMEHSVFRGHNAGINTVAFAPDGKHVATGDGKGDTIVWEWRTGTQKAMLRGHPLKITAVAWSPDGQRLASASDDKTIKIWEPLSGTETLTLIGHRAGVTTVAWDPDGHFLGSGSWDGTTKLWDGRPVAD